MERYQKFLSQVGALSVHTAILQAMKELNSLERKEWANVQLLKCDQMMRQGQSKQLKQSLSLLIQGCHEYKIQGYEKDVERLIVKIYAEEDYKKYMPVMQNYGFNTRQQEIMPYNEGILTKMGYTIRQWF